MVQSEAGLGLYQGPVQAQRACRKGLLVRARGFLLGVWGFSERAFRIAHN